MSEDDNPPDYASEAPRSSSTVKLDGPISSTYIFQEMKCGCSQIQVEPAVKNSKERMEAVKRRVMGLFGNRENVTSVFLGGVLVVLGVRSSAQQREIEALEAEKSALRTQNKAMSSAMWEWRQHLFSLADSSDDHPSLSAATLRRIYGEDDLPTHLPLRLPEGLPEEEEDSIPIA